jgi:hypothetical protein
MPVAGSMIFYLDNPEIEHLKVEKVEKANIKPDFLNKVKKFAKSPNKGYVYPSYIIGKRKELKIKKEINGTLIHLEQEYDYNMFKEKVPEEMTEELPVRNNVIINPINYGDYELNKRIAQAFKKDL